MAQLVNTQININGNAIAQYSSFQLTQGIFAHHTFRLVCPAESIDGTIGSVFNQSKNLMGATLTAQVASVGMQGEMKFSGIVTQVETSRFSGHTGDVIITGYSPTIVLDNAPHCKSWEKKAVKNIVQDVLKHFPQNTLNPKVATIYPETLAYTVQYRETAWQFLSRLCGTYGEWFYYDGEALIAGAPTGGQAVPLTFGSNLSNFNMALEVRPAKSQSMAYDYLNYDVYKSEPSGIEGKAGLNELGKHALQASNTVYGTQPKVWNNNFITNKKQLDDVVNMRAAMQSSNHVRFNGTSGQPGVKVGGQVSVQGQNVFSLSDESYGDYTVIAVNHFFDGQGNYNNDFVAVPASIKVPPVIGISEPKCETQSALVTDNHDPKGLGRVRVKMHWMNGSEKTPWIRVTSPHGGGGKGMFFIPEIDEEVIVGFEGDSAVKPYVIGTVYHGKANNTFSNAGNDVKALQTRSGNKIIMNDKDGSIVVSDPSGNVVTMHGNGEVTIHAPTKLTITSPDIIIAANNSISMSVGGSEQAPAPTASFVLDNGGQSASTMAKQTISLFSEKDTDITSINTLNTATQELAMSGSVSTNINAGELHVNGGSMARISSADTDII
jgi:type VI secretion system secreted protein VgrG